MQNFQQSQTNKQISGEYSKDISYPNLKNSFSGHLHRKQEGDGYQQDRKRTRMDAVQQCREGYQWQKQGSIIAQLPNQTGGSGALLENDDSNNCSRNCSEYNYYSFHLMG